MKMLKAERQDKILEILSLENKIIASELSVRLEVSEDTIRRDIKELDQRGLLKKVHSGAVKNGPLKEDFDARIDLNLEEKIRLAKKGAELIKPGSVILIDDGTTNYQVIKQLDKHMRCTVITNSIPIILLLRDYPNIDVITLGGNLYKSSMATYGYEVIKQLELLHPDLYFMGIYCMSSEVGISHSSMEECQLKQKMLSVSYQTAVLVTKEKIGSVSNYVICKTGDITYLITDSDQ